MIALEKIYKILNDCKSMYADEIIENILESREIKDVEHFLFPEEDDLLLSEDLMYIDKVCEIVGEALDNDYTIGILYDCDTDGVTSGTIITRYLLNFTDNIITHINQGKAHGLIDIEWCKDCDVVIIVDSLNTDITNYERLYKDGKDVIVLDHHKINDSIPYDNLVTLVSSQRNYSNPNLSGAGVVWKVCRALDETLNTNYSDDLIDLAACGILADVSDVSETSKENRYIVYHGLKNLVNPGLKKIIGSYEFNSKAVLFSVAPLINSCCRCGDNNVAMRMFLSDNNKDVLMYKKKLEGYKELQNEEVQRLLPNVYDQVNEQSDEPVLFITIDTKYGIAGLLGNRILEEVNKPLFIISGEDNDNYYGSMRSIGYGDFASLVNDTGLARCMGHEEAAGIIIPKNTSEEFLNQIRKVTSGLIQSTTSEIEVDAEIEIGDLSRELIDKVKAINFVSGKGFKPLIFKVVGADDYEISNFKQGKHLVVKPNDWTLFIYWNWNGSYEDMEDSAMMNEPFECVGELDSGFLGRQFKLKVIMNDYKVG